LYNVSLQKKDAAARQSQQPQKIQLDSSFQSSDFSTSSHIPLVTRSLMASGYIESLTEDDFIDFFSHFGELVDFTDICHKRKGWKFVFLKFASSRSVDIAVASGPFTINNAIVKVAKAKDF